MSVKSPTEILRTETPDGTPDSGPRHRGDTRIWFCALATFILGAAFTVLMYGAYPLFFWVPILVLGIPCALSVWSIFRANRDYNRHPPQSHSILAGELGFDLLSTTRGVAATAFFAPDAIVHGGTTTLLLFMENYTSRQRIVKARFGHLPGIGRPEATFVRLHLAAGQAAVYEMTVRATADISTGNHRLSVMLDVEQPEGAGQRLPGARKHMYDVLIARFAAPLEIVTGRPESLENDAPLPAPRYHLIASASEALPQIEQRLAELRRAA